jgi:YHS domain-containing protein
MKTRSLFTAVASIAVLAVTLYAADEIKLDGIKCVMNPKAAAKAEKSVDYKGGKVFFCCDNCPKGFAKKIKEGDELVAAKGNAQLVATHQAKQAKCVFTGGPLKTELTVAGATVQFCCDNCKGKAAKMEGDKQLVALFGDKAFEKGGFKVGEENKE